MKRKHQEIDNVITTNNNNTTTTTTIITTTTTITNIDEESEAEILLNKVLLLPNDHQIPIKGAFISQLLHLTTMQSQIVKDISLLREKNKIRLLHCPGYSTNEKSDRSFIIITSDYLNDLDVIINSISDGDIINSLIKFKQWIKYCRKISIFKNEFINGIIENMTTTYPLTNNDIDNILSIGFLSYRRDVNADDMLWFSHPKISELGQLMLKIETTIITAINRRRYKEISLKELNKQNIRTPFSIEYHVYELIGSNILISKAGTVNDIILRKK